MMGLISCAAKNTIWSQTKLELFNGGCKRRDILVCGRKLQSQIRPQDVDRAGELLFLLRLTLRFQSRLYSIVVS